MGLSYVLPYAAAVAAAVVRALDAETPPDDARDKMHVGERRRMARCRLEPELATWVWAVLVPAPRRSARSWFADPEAGPPCYVPARLAQPLNTRPKTLDLRLPTARTVLVALGTDLLRGDVAGSVVTDVLARAEEAPHLLFLVATNHADRIADVAWPENVRPALRIAAPPKSPTTDDERANPLSPPKLAEALAAFEAAGHPGVLVQDEFWGPLSDDLARRARDHAFAVVLRGGSTAQSLYDQALELRDMGVRLVSASNRCRPWDVLYEVSDEPARPARAGVPASLPSAS